MRTRFGRRTLLGVVLVVALAGVGCGDDDDEDETTGAGAATTTTSGTTPPTNPPYETFVANLTGEVEVPTGDPDGSGTATVTINAENEVCSNIQVSGIESATAAHIHAGGQGVAGPIVVPLQAPETGSGQGCETVDDEQLLEAIARTPGNFYVNVHNTAYPMGAVRGQLEKQP